MNSVKNLDELTATSWARVEKNKLNKKIRGSPSHLRMWKVNRGLQEYEEILSFRFKTYIDSKLENINSSDTLVALDIGCGSGRFLSELTSTSSSIAGYGITNILFEGDYAKDKIIMGDISSEYYNRLDTRYPTPKLPYILPNIPANSVDLIVSVFALQYLKAEDIIKAINHSNRILKPNGLALLHIDVTFVEGDNHIKEHLKKVDSPSQSIVYSQYTGKVQVLKIDKAA